MILNGHGFSKSFPRSDKNANFTIPVMNFLKKVHLFLLFILRHYLRGEEIPKVHGVGPISNVGILSIKDGHILNIFKFFPSAEEINPSIH